MRVKFCPEIAMDIYRGLGGIFFKKCRSTQFIEGSLG
ncbi:MAG: hypothetical protein JWO30_1905 [Fibrobacteres bacterium]|nr:hypothetical protein [Fibrobacterota bacterium]